jgi:hypothetical protein
MFESGSRSRTKDHTQRCRDDHLALKMMPSEVAHTEGKRMSTCRK